MGYRKYFTDTVTVYHRRRAAEGKDDVFARAVFPGVMVRQKTERSVDASGVIRTANFTSVTILSQEGVEIAEGDYLAMGQAPELSDTYEMNRLRKEYRVMQVKSVADNRNKPYLKHIRVECA